MAAASGVTTLDLELNEPAGATVAHDDSGYGHDGAIGSHITMNGAYANWDRHAPGAGIYYGAAHLMVVNDDSDGSIDPGTGNFSVEIRYRSTDKFGNVIQKGQAKSVGGQVKFQQPNGIISCMFKSPNGTATVGSKTPLNDGQWHVVRCDRTPTQVTMYVDGAYRNRIRHTTGNINNTKPWTIGGKLDCDTTDPTTGADSCDYFPGDIDYVHFTKG
ncbi:MAG: LamG domain-containing protein [Nocardioides sp.]